MGQNKIPSVRQVLEQLSTEQLDQMLDEELHSEAPDADAVRMIMKILRERDDAERKDTPVVLTPQQIDAWEKYQRDTAQIWKEENRIIQFRRWALKAASIAAVLVLLFLPVLPQEAGAESLWNRLARLTDDLVDFFGPNDNMDRIEAYEFKTDNPGLQQLYNAVVDLGVTKPVVPMWLPSENEIAELKTVVLPLSKSIQAVFPHEDGNIIYKLDIYDAEISHKFTRDETEIKKFAVNETTFYIMRNLNYWVAIWNVDEIECFIQIDCQEDVLHKILKSIYSMEDT